MKDNKRLTILLILLLLLLATMVLIVSYPDSRIPQINPERFKVLKKWQHELTERLVNREYREAELVARRILHSDSENVEALRGLIRIYHDRNEFGRAEELCRKILRYSPEDAVARNNLALLLIKRNEVETGFHELQLAYRVAPDDQVINYNLNMAAQLFNREGYQQPGKLPDISARPEILFIEVELAEDVK